MNTNELAVLAMIGGFTVLALSGYVSLWLACRDERPERPDWLETWSQ